MTLSPELILITGQAGAGHSTSLKILEDLGFVTVDNLPLALVDQLVAIEVETNGQALAICADQRTSGFDVTAIERLIANLRQKFDTRFKHIHLVASEAEILRRYQSTRRAHPLSATHQIEEAIALDGAQLAPIAALADIEIDTTALSPTALRSHILTAVKFDTAGGLGLTVQSFAFKNGVPAAADYVFDVRFLRNPHWDAGLRALTGQDDEVFDYIAADYGFGSFFTGLYQLFPPILSASIRDGRPQLMIAFGCTGGRHRSVACATHFANWLRKEGISVTLQHRELDEA